MNNYSRHLDDASVDVDDQLNQLTVQLARGILTASRRIFAIVEWSADESEFRWPWHQPIDRNEASSDHWRLLHRLVLKLPANGVWCVVDKASNGVTEAVIHPNLRGTKFLTAAHRQNYATAVSQLERELGELIVRSDESEICRLVSVLDNEYDWIGIYIRRLNPIELAALLRHCEIVYVAVNAPEDLNREHQRMLKSWMDARIPLKGVFRVIAS
jgi:hypothetical protein